jgi:hypothetical protein
MASPLADLGIGSMELPMAGFEYWITLGINIVLSTIVGGVVLLVVVGVLNRKFNETAEVHNAFLMALVVNVINFFGVMGLLAAFLPIPYLSLLLPLIVWIALGKLFFPGFGLMHVVIIAVIGFALSVLLVPSITAIVVGFLPL